MAQGVGLLWQLRLLFIDPMAKRATTPKKTVTETNLAALGADRLAALLLDAASADATLKRRLRMELAAEISAADLAFEIDKRLNALATSRARISWRKRPVLLNDLQSVRRVIVDRLAPLDINLALDRLVAWFDLYPALSARVSDAKGELALLFDAASSDLALVASAAGPDSGAPVLVEALSTRLNQWASWVGRGAQGLSVELAQRLLVELTHGKPRPAGRLALVVRKLADRSGDLDAWILSISQDDARKSVVGSEIARRLAEAGRAAEARDALEGARPASVPPSRWGRAPQPPPTPGDDYLVAEIAVLEVEGRREEAEQARWRIFERTLSAEVLRILIGKLPDFDDVVALDRAFEVAAKHPDAMKGLAFLMNWPALREAAELVVRRAMEVRGSHDEVPLWASRLAGRHPLAALLLVRARARALVNLGSGITDEVQGLIGEAEVLAGSIGDEASADNHAGFVAELQALAAPGRRRW